MHKNIKKGLTTLPYCDIIIKHQFGEHIAGWSSSVARRAHNPKVVGSNPAPATIRKAHINAVCEDMCFLFCPNIHQFSSVLSMFCPGRSKKIRGKKQEILIPKLVNNLSLCSSSNFLLLASFSLIFSGAELYQRCTRRCVHRLVL